MCGIAGQFGHAEPGFAPKALAGLAHRGPDGSGQWAADGVELVHTRLAILDVSDSGKQPMVLGRAPGRKVLVFNGEIFNFRELRRELEAAGEEFVGHSDTEVLLHLLVREGVACLPKLAGMFAFAYWDETTGEGLLARDAYGIKPLYYRAGNRDLQFASEYRVLKRSDDSPDPTALRDYLLWGSVPEPATLSRAIRQVPAGHWLTWSTRGVRLEPWYRSPLQGRTAQAPADRAAARVREAFLESIERHLVSDVPVGIFLSGGVDSSVVVAAARYVLGPRADIRTFSIGFDDPALDESQLARRTAERFAARHTEWRMRDEEGCAEVEAFLAAVDQPGIDGFNTWCVSQLARREGIKVVLSGLGGDELFGGYQSFRQIPRMRLAHRSMGRSRPLAAWLAEQRAEGSRWRRLGLFLRGQGCLGSAYHTQRGIFTLDESDRLVEFLLGERVVADASELPIPEDLGDREAVAWLELSRYMRNQLLRDSDVYSMAHGLELRVPFVDVRFIAALANIPARDRLRQGKRLLVDAFAELPRWVTRQPKRGFVFPFEKWMTGRFGDHLGAVGRISPVALTTWYRTWCLAAAARHLGAGER